MHSEAAILRQIDESLRIAGEVLHDPSVAEEVVVRCVALYLALPKNEQSDALRQSSLAPIVKSVLEEATDLSQRLQDLRREESCAEDLEGPKSGTVLKKAREKVEDLRRSTLPPATV